MAVILVMPEFATIVEDCWHVCGVENSLVYM